MPRALHCCGSTSLALLTIMQAHFSTALEGADLACSACKLFIEQYHQQCAKIVFKTPASVKSVYRKRFEKILKEKAMSKTTADRLLAELRAAHPGSEHALYTKLCKRKNVVCEEEYTDSPAGNDDVAAKLELAGQALDKTLAFPKGGTQWAVSGGDGKRQYVDFNKAMQGGIMSNLQSGSPLDVEPGTIRGDVDDISARL